MNGSHDSVDGHLNPGDSFTDGRNMGGDGSSRGAGITSQSLDLVGYYCKP